MVLASADQVRDPLLLADVVRDERVTVLQAGAVLAEGTYDEVRTDPRVVTAYLGESDHA